jgi:hypothetical protein
MPPSTPNLLGIFQDDTAKINEPDPRSMDTMSEVSWKYYIFKIKIIAYN